jgi:hypothetical protein
MGRQILLKYREAPAEFVTRKTMTIAALVIALALAGIAQETPQEKKVPKDSLMLVVTGCLKGRVLAVSDVRQEDTQTGPIVKAKSFRVAAKGDVMDDIKKYDKHLVEATGLVKKSALIEPGLKVGKGITIGGGPPMAGSGAGRPVPSEALPVMDVTAVRVRNVSCAGS